MGLFSSSKEDSRALLSQSKLGLQPSYSVDSVSTYGARKTSAKKKYRLRRPKLSAKFRKLASDSSLYSKSSSSEYVPPEGFLFMVDPPRKELVDLDDQPLRNVLDEKKKKSLKKLPKINLGSMPSKGRSKQNMSKFYALDDADSKSSVSYEPPVVTFSHSESASVGSFGIQTIDSAEASKAQEKQLDQQHTYLTAKSTSIEEDSDDYEPIINEVDEEEQEIVQHEFNQIRFDQNLQRLERVETNSTLSTRSSIFSMDQVAQIAAKLTPPRPGPPPTKVEFASPVAKEKESVAEAKKTPSTDMLKFTKVSTSASSTTLSQRSVSSKRSNDTNSIFRVEEKQNPFHKPSTFDENDDDLAWSSPFQFTSDENVPGKSKPAPFDLAQSIRQASAQRQAVERSDRKDPAEDNSQRPDPSPRRKPKKEVRTFRVEAPPPPPGPPPSIQVNPSYSSAIMASMAYRKTLSTSSRSLAVANLETVDRVSTEASEPRMDVPRVIHATESMDSGVSSLVDSVARPPSTWKRNAQTLMRNYGGLEKLEAVRENYHMFQG